MQGENESCMKRVVNFTAAERARRVRLILFDVDDPCIEEFLDEHNAPQRKGSVTAGWRMLSLWVQS